MKKTLILLSMTATMLAACNREPIAPEEPASIDLQNYSINITVNEPDAFGTDTKGVKTGWEAGDKIYLYIIPHDTYTFSPFWFSISYDGSQWDSVGERLAAYNDFFERQYDVLEVAAIYFPYAVSDPRVGNGTLVGENLMFTNTRRAYYLKDDKAVITIDEENSTLSISLNLTAPEGFVQFFIPDDNPIDGKYTLHEESISSSHYVYYDALYEGSNRWLGIGVFGDMDETFTLPTAGVEMPGMATTINGDKGYYFWGQIPTEKRGVASTYSLSLKEYDSEGNLVNVKKKDFNKTLYCKNNGVLSHAAVRLNTTDSGWREEPEGTVCFFIPDDAADSNNKYFTLLEGSIRPLDRNESVKAAYDTRMPAGYPIPSRIETINGVKGYCLYGVLPQEKRGVESTYNLTVREYDSKENLVSIKTKSINQTLYVKENDVLSNNIVLLDITDSSWQQPQPGVFSVGANKKVVFAQGNLMAKIGSYTAGDYYATASEWKFGGATEVIGNAADSGNALFTAGNDACVGKWVDTFCWQGESVATSNRHHGLIQATYSFEPEYSTYISSIANDSLYDGCWDNLTISNGGGYTTWRPLTMDEWNYIKNNESKYAPATVKGVPGIILLPDDFTDPSTSRNSELIIPWQDLSEIWDMWDMHEKNTYDDSGWAFMVAAGAIFLPSTTTNRDKYNENPDTGWYWGIDGLAGMYAPIWTISEISGYAYAVRLVRDVE